MSVKLSGKLPKGDRSGLDLLQGELVRDPSRMHYVVVAIDCAFTRVDHGEDGDTYTPTARLLYVEPVRDELEVEVVKELLGSMRANRVGNGTVGFDLGLAELREAGATEGPGS